MKFADTALVASVEWKNLFTFSKWEMISIWNPSPKAQPAKALGQRHSVWFSNRDLRMLAGEINRVHLSKMRASLLESGKAHAGGAEMYMLQDVVKPWQVRAVSPTLTTSTIQETGTPLMCLS